MSIKNIRTGIGFDVHAYASDRPLILGGISIPYSRGLAGHSDADVLTHAIIDSLVGVTMCKDIGTLYPDTDDKYKGIKSVELLEDSIIKIKELNYSIINIDTVIIAQEPKLITFIPSIRKNIAKVVNLSELKISIKATTTEYLGFVGRKEGIASLCVATVYYEGT